ncbi:MAG TPA: hypothetical protein DCZ12_15925 [Gammaproteobacteria bacterium]|nr:hypothetical protein [Gammaproteobacteria bacterium]
MSKKINGSQYLGPDGFATTTHVVEAQVGQSLDFFLEPNNWDGIAHRIRPHDKIEVVSENVSFYATLYVVSASKRWVKVKVLEHYNFVDEEHVFDGDMRVETRGRKGWCVIKNEDNSVLFENCGSQEQAISKMVEYQAAA